MRKLYLAGLTFLALSVALIASRDTTHAVPSARHTPAPRTGAAAGAEGARWFSSVRHACNAVEVETIHRQRPPPSSVEGAGFSAACFALAGRIDRARTLIDGLPASERHRAASIVFGVGHPVADAGDDSAAGPIMELVVDYWPDHYMALYHAGMARFGSGDREGARAHLERFLEVYELEDGWTRSAREALAEPGR